MFSQERLKAITTLLARKQSLSVRELQKTLNVSPATLRRDLAELEQTHQVVRVHGGIVHPSVFRGEPTFDQKSRESAQVKREMAEVAASMVPEGVTLFVDSGTTCLEVGRRLLTRKDLTLVTNSVPLVNAAASAAARVICLGGEIRIISRALVGSFALSWLDHLRAGWAFLGASGLSAREGASTTELAEASVKQCFIARAAKRVLLADASKWEAPSTVQFAPWKDFDLWITSFDLPDPAASEIGRLSLEVIRAPRK